MSIKNQRKSINYSSKFQNSLKHFSTFLTCFMLCHLLSCWIKWFNFPNISLKMKSSNFIKLFHVSYTSDLPCGHTSSSCVRTEPHPIPAKQHGTVVPAAVPFDTRKATCKRSMSPSSCPSPMKFPPPKHRRKIRTTFPCFKISPPNSDCSRIFVPFGVFSRLKISSLHHSRSSSFSSSSAFDSSGSLIFHSFLLLLLFLHASVMFSLPFLRFAPWTAKTNR